MLNQKQMEEKIRFLLKDVVSWAHLQYPPDPFDRDSSGLAPLIQTGVAGFTSVSVKQV